MVWEPLEAQWEEYFKLAKKYFGEYGDLLIPQNYKTEKDIKLGTWIQNQRQAYNGKGKNKISLEQRVKLDSINMIWNPYDELWNKKFQLAKEYFEEHGNLLIPSNYKTKNNVSIGKWIDRQRQTFKEKGKGTLTQEQIEKLESIEMVWNIKKES